jgi:SnoaL-like domain/EthD domain
MLKVVALMKRKPELSRNEFIAYYETRHVPLIQRLLPEIIDYRRNYVDTSVTVPFAAVPDFDVISEIWFKDRASYNSFLTRCADPELAALVAEDEEHVFDRSATRLFAVEEMGAVSQPTEGEAGASLKTLQDEREIARALGRFSRLLDSKSIADLEQVFARDLSFDYGKGGDQHGIEALHAWMHAGLDPCGGTQHLIGNVMVDVTGDSALSRAYVQARHQRPSDLGGQVFDANGEYVDRWERRSEGWRIVRRDARWFVLTGDSGVIGVDEVSLD